MSDESRLQTTPASLSLLRTRSGLIARGLRDAEVLAFREPADPLWKTLEDYDEGDVRAQFELGEAYYKGEGVLADIAEALVLVPKSC